LKIRMPGYRTAVLQTWLDHGDSAIVNATEPRGALHDG